MIGATLRISMDIIRYRALTNQKRYLHYEQRDEPSTIIDPAFTKAVTCITSQLLPEEKVVAFWLELDWPEDE